MKNINIKISLICKNKFKKVMGYSVFVSYSIQMVVEDEKENLYTINIFKDEDLKYMITVHLDEWFTIEKFNNLLKHCNDTGKFLELQTECEYYNYSFDNKYVQRLTKIDFYGL